VVERALDSGITGSAVPGSITKLHSAISEELAAILAGNNINLTCVILPEEIQQKLPAMEDRHKVHQGRHEHLKEDNLSQGVRS
jgi:hypothetical protein